MIKDNNIMIIVGESSADLYASFFIREFKKLDPFTKLWGTGGERMEEEGFEALYHIRELSLIGLFEIIFHLRRIVKIRRQLLKEIKRRKPLAILFVDFPDFNLSLAKKLKNEKILKFHYISPTVWAWRYGRVKKIKKYIDKIFLIFPFEKEIYKKEGINHEFVGHPLFEIVKPAKTPEEIRKNYGVKDKIHIVLMPGSRNSELKFHTPALLNAVKKLKNRYGKSLFISLIKAPHIKKSLYKPFAKENILIIEKEKYSVMNSADLIISTSGTSNFEAMILKKPVVVIYKLSKLSYLLGKHFVKIRKFSIVNILAGKEIIPELIQENLTGENIFKESLSFIENKEKRESLIKEYEKILSLYNDVNFKASEKLALSIWKELKEKKDE